MAVSPFLRSPLRGAGLSTKLVVLSALLTALTVALAFVALNLELRTETRRLLAATLAQHQRVLAAVQQRELEELARVSALMSENPTLRAAIETYHTEAGTDRRLRGDLLATIQAEAGRIAAALAPDLLVVTDPLGRVLAASGRPADRPAIGADLSERAVVARALAQDAPVGPGNFSVVRLGERVFQVGCVPILLQGHVIGTLIFGERIDQGFVDGLRTAFDSDVVVTAGDRVLGSTFPAGTAPAVRLRPAAPPRAGDGPADGTTVLSIGGEDFVAAALSLGGDDREGPIQVHLLRSLSRALDAPNRSLLATLFGYGSLVVLVAGLSASVVSRSVLRPLEQLVAFMRDAAGAPAGAGPRRFETAGAGTEIRVLGETFNRLMESLRQHEQRLLATAREDMTRLERLKESEKLAAMGRMLSGAAHEINNPLTGVVGNIEMVLEGRGLDADARRRLEQVRREGQRIVALVRSLLRVARREGGRRTAVDLNQVIRDTVALRRHDFQRARIAVDLNVQSEPIRLMANELELQQVFLNILNNAYDALCGSTPRPVLAIATAEGPAEATVEFRDNGPGIQDPAQVFEHFYTTKPVGQGTGLGLSISQAIVQGHGGRIGADNPPEGGARFTIVLPRTAAAAEGPAPPAATDARVPETRRPLPAAVLVVDDEPVVLDLQMAILDALGASAVAARTGSEAIDHLRRRDFDLIVSDMMLPGDVDGLELYRWAGAHRRRGTLGFLFVTGESPDASPERPRPGARCLQKPFTMEEYVIALRQAWDELQTAA